MKNGIFTQTKTSFLTLALFFAFITASAQTRIYLIGDESSAESTEWLYYGVEDISRVMWIWDSWDNSGLTADASGGVNGPTGNYIQFTSKTYNYFGGDYILQEGATMDLTKVTEDSYMHIALKTNIVNGNPAITLRGINGSTASYTFNIDKYPVEERDNTTWKEFDIPMYEFFDGTDGTDGLDYSEVLQGVIAYLGFSINECPQGTQLAIDNLYFYNLAGNSSSVESIQAANQATLEGNVLTLAEGITAAIYNAAGQLVMKANQTQSLESLASGIYVIQAGNTIIKYAK